MIFENSAVVSPVQLAVEAVLEQTSLRLDTEARKERTKAAMIMEVARYGYALSKIARVATRAKVSTATLYRDFHDRETLLLQSLEWIIALFARNWLQKTDETEPLKRVQALLMAHGAALSDPFMGNLFRLYIHVAHTSAPHLFAFARAAREANLSVWYRELEALERDGHLVFTDYKLIIAILLGAIERPTILSRLAFGDDNDHQPKLGAVAVHAALALFQLFGTDAFWSGQREALGRRPALDWGTSCGAVHGTALGKPPLLLDPPSKRLTAYAKRILARDVNRLDADGRKVRIQLAAMLECCEVGYEAATMASVAVRAGVSTATFYTDYDDKRALFIDAISLQSRFFVDYKGLLDPEASPADTMASLVYSIAHVLADPQFLWFHRVSMASEISDASQLIQSSRDTRTHTETFWFGYLETLEADGFLEPYNPALTINLLLGATQRRSVLSMLFFGADDVSDENLAQLAVAATDVVMRLVGKVSP